MRVFYFDELKRDWTTDKGKIIFTGSLILRGDPESPLEGATKGYLEYKIKNLTTDDIGEGRIPLVAYPALEGDILNKEGSNIFKTKEGIVKPGDYLQPTVDRKGRVIKGKTKVEITEDDIDNIDFDGLDFSNYVKKGSDQEKFYIEDFTHQHAGYDLMTPQERKINATFRLDYIVDQNSPDTVLVNEESIDRIILATYNKWFDTVRTKDLGLIGNRGLQESNDFGGLPWHRQRNLHNETDLSEVFSRPKKTFRMIDESGKTLSNTKDAPIGQFINKNYLYIIYKPTNKSLSEFLRYELTEDGGLHPDYETVKRKPVIWAPNVNFVHTGYNVTPVVLGNRVFFPCREDLTKFGFFTIELNDRGMGIGNWTRTDRETGLTTNGFHESWFMVGRTFYFYNHNDNTFRTTTLNADGTADRWDTMPEQFRFTGTNGNTRGVNFCKVGNYVYAFFGFVERGGRIPATPNNTYARIEIRDNRMYGSWEYTRLPFTVSKPGWSYVVTTKTRVYWASGSRIHEFLVNDDLSLTFVKAFNGFGSIYFTKDAIVNRAGASLTWYPNPGYGRNDYSDVLDPNYQPQESVSVLPSLVCRGGGRYPNVDGKAWLRQRNFGTPVEIDFKSQKFRPSGDKQDIWLGCSEDASLMVLDESLHLLGVRKEGESVTGNITFVTNALGSVDVGDTYSIRPGLLPNFTSNVEVLDRTPVAYGDNTYQLDVKRSGGKDIVRIMGSGPYGINPEVTEVSTLELGNGYSKYIKLFLNRNRLYIFNPKTNDFYFSYLGVNGAVLGWEKMGEVAKLPTLNSNFFQCEFFTLGGVLYWIPGMFVEGENNTLKETENKFVYSSRLVNGMFVGGWEVNELNTILPKGRKSIITTQTKVYIVNSPNGSSFGGTKDNPIQISIFELGNRFTLNHIDTIAIDDREVGKEISMNFAIGKDRLYTIARIGGETVTRGQHITIESIPVAGGKNDYHAEHHYTYLPDCESGIIPQNNFGGRPWVNQNNICYPLDRPIGDSLAFYTRAYQNSDRLEDKNLIVHKGKLIYGSLSKGESGYDVPMIAHNLDSMGDIDEHRPFNNFYPKLPGLVVGSGKPASQHAPLIYRDSLYVSHLESYSGNTAKHALYRLKLNGDATPNGSWVKLKNILTATDGVYRSTPMILRDELFYVIGNKVLKAPFKPDGTVGDFKLIYEIKNYDGSARYGNGTPISIDHDIYILHNEGKVSGGVTVHDRIGDYTILSTSEDNEITGQRFYKSNDSPSSDTIYKIAVLKNKIFYFTTKGKKLSVYSRYIELDGTLGRFVFERVFDMNHSASRIAVAITKGRLFITTGKELMSMSWPSGKNDYSFELSGDYKVGTCDNPDNYAKEIYINEFSGQPWLNQTELCYVNEPTLVGDVISYNTGLADIRNRPIIIANKDKLISVRTSTEFRGGRKAHSKYWKLNDSGYFAEGQRVEYLNVFPYINNLGNVHHCQPWIYNNRLYVSQGGESKNQPIYYIDLNSEGLANGNWRTTTVPSPDTTGDYLSPVLLGDRIYYFNTTRRTVYYGEIENDGDITNWYEVEKDQFIPNDTSMMYRGETYVNNGYIYLIPGTYHASSTGNKITDGKPENIYYRIRFVDKRLTGTWEKLTAPSNFNRSAKRIIAYRDKLFFVEREGYTAANGGVYGPSYITEVHLDDDGKIVKMANKQERVILDAKNRYLHDPAGVAVTKGGIMIHDGPYIHYIRINAGKNDYTFELNKDIVRDTCDIRSNYAGEVGDLCEFGSRYFNGNGRPWREQRDSNNIGESLDFEDWGGLFTFKPGPGDVEGQDKNINSDNYRAFVNEGKLGYIRTVIRRLGGINDVFTRISSGVPIPINGGDVLIEPDAGSKNDLNMPVGVDRVKPDCVMYNNNIFTIAGWGDGLKILYRNLTEGTWETVDAKVEDIPEVSAPSERQVGFSHTYFMIGNRIYYFDPYKNRFYYSDVNGDGIPSGLELYPGSKSIPTSNTNRVGSYFVSVGPYLYWFPGRRDPLIKDPVTQNRSYFRIRVTNGEFVGDWKEILYDTLFKESDKEVLVYGNRIYLMSISDPREVGERYTVEMREIIIRDDFSLSYGKFLPGFPGRDLVIMKNRVIRVVPGPNGYGEQLPIGGGFDDYGYETSSGYMPPCEVKVPYNPNNSGRPWINNHDICDFSELGDVGKDVIRHYTVGSKLSMNHKRTTVVHKNKLILFSSFNTTDQAGAIKALELDEEGKIDVSKGYIDNYWPNPVGGRVNVNHYEIHPMIYGDYVYALCKSGDGSNYIGRLRLNEDGGAVGGWEYQFRINFNSGWPIILYKYHKYVYMATKDELFRCVMQKDGRLTNLEKIKVFGFTAYLGGSYMVNDAIHITNSTGRIFKIVLGMDGNVLEYVFVDNNNKSIITNGGGNFHSLVYKNYRYALSSQGGKLNLFRNRIKPDGSMGDQEVLLENFGSGIFTWPHRMGTLSIAKNRLYICIGKELYSVSFPGGKNDYSFELNDDYHSGVCEQAYIEPTTIIDSGFNGRPWHDQDLLCHQEPVAVENDVTVLFNDSPLSVRTKSNVMVVKDKLVIYSPFKGVNAEHGTVAFPLDEDGYPSVSGYINEYWPSIFNNDSRSSHATTPFIRGDYVYVTHTNREHKGTSNHGLWRLRLNPDGTPSGNWEYLCDIDGDHNYITVPLIYKNFVIFIIKDKVFKGEFDKDGRINKFEETYRINERVSHGQSVSFKDNIYKLYRGGEYDRFKLRSDGTVAFRDRGKFNQVVDARSSDYITTDTGIIGVHECGGHIAVTNNKIGTDGIIGDSEVMIPNLMNSVTDRREYYLNVAVTKGRLIINEGVRVVSIAINRGKNDYSFELNSNYVPGTCDIEDNYYQDARDPNEEISGLHFKGNTISILDGSRFPKEWVPGTKLRIRLPQKYTCVHEKTMDGLKVRSGIIGNFAHGLPRDPDRTVKEWNSNREYYYRKYTLGYMSSGIGEIQWVVRLEPRAGQGERDWRWYTEDKADWYDIDGGQDIGSLGGTGVIWTGSSMRAYSEYIEWLVVENKGKTITVEISNNSKRPPIRPGGSLDWDQENVTHPENKGKLPSNEENRLASILLHNGSAGAFYIKY